MAINGQDIGLLFGVLGGGKISGESGVLIRKQLNQLVGELNKSRGTNERAIRLSLDVTNTKAALEKSVKKLMSTMEGQNKFKLKVAEIKADSAIKKLRDQLNAVLKTIKVDTGFNVSIGTNGVTSAVKEITGDAKTAVLSLTEVNAILKEIGITNQGISKDYKGVKNILGGESADGANLQSVDALKQKYLELQTAVNNLQEKKRSASREEVDQIYTIQAEMQRLIASTWERVDAERAVANAQRESSNTAQNTKTAQQETITRNNLLKQTLGLIQRITKAQQDWTAAEHGTRSEDYKKLEEYKNTLQALYDTYSKADAPIGDFRESLSRISEQFSDTSNNIKAAGENTRTFTERIGGLAAKFSTWFSITQIIMAAVRAIRQMVDAVIDVDTAMTELRKVTDETEATYIKYLEDATVRAKGLGATISDTVNASADFARLGYDLEESASLADAALVYKNVGDGIEDITDASESLISTIQAFGIEAENAMFIVDKFNEVGNNFAISSKGIGDALLRSASALDAGGNTLDESIALITAANTVVQDADKVGTTMKTISMFLRAAKTEAEEAGESTEGMASSVSELREELLALTGGKVDIQIDEDTFKSTYQIMQELSEVWGELTDISQANILEMVGGKRNSNVVAALLNNFEIAEDVVRTSEEAAGSALAENEKFLASIRGHIAEFQAAFEELSISLIDSGFVNNVIDLGTGLLNVASAIVSVVDVLGGLNTVLAVTLAIVAVLKADLIHGTVVSAITSIGKAIGTLTGLITKLGTALKIFGAMMKATKASTSTAMVAFGQSTTILGKLTTALNAAGIAATSAQVAMFGIAAALIVVPKIIGAIVDAYKENHKSIEELNEEYGELRSQIDEAANSFRELKSTSDEVIPRFVELAKGVDKFGKNVSLTDEEYAEFLELNNRLAEMFPEINMGMDSNGNAMLALSYSADTLTESLNALVEAQRDAANQQIADTMPDILKNIEDTNDVYRDEIDELRDIQDEYKEVYEDFLDQNLPTNIGRYSTQEAGLAAAEEFIKKAKELGIHGEVVEDSDQTINNGYTFSVNWDYAPLDDAGQMFLMPYIDEQYAIALERYDKLINDYQEKIEAKWAQLNPVVNSWMQTDFMYQDLNASMQQIAQTMVSGLDFGSLGLTTEEDVQQYVDDYIVEPLFLAAPEVKEAFAQITDWQEELEEGTLSQEEFSNNIAETFDTMFSSMRPETVEEFQDIFVAAFNEMGITGNDFTSVLANLIEEWGSAPEVIDEYGTRLSELSDTISGLKKSYDLLATAQTEMAGDSGLSSDTIQSMADIEENYLDYLYEENGLIKLNTAAWEARSRAVAEADLSALEDEIGVIEERNVELKESINYYEEQRAIGNDGGIWTNLIAEATNELEKNNNKLKDNIELLSLLKSVYDSFNVAPWTDTLNEFDAYVSEMEKIAGIQHDLSNGYTISAQKAREFAGVYPELLEAATVAADGQISLNADIVNSFLQGKEVEIRSSIDAEIKKLEAKRAVLQAELDIVNAQIEAALSGDAAAVQSANEKAAAQMAIQQAVLTAAEQAGIDETTANQLALAAMTEDWDTFRSLAETAVYNLDNESATAFTSIMGNFATMSQNVVNNTNEIIGAFSQMGLALKNAMNGLTTGEYNASITADTVSGESKEAIDDLITGMFDSAKSDYASGESSFSDRIGEWQGALQDIADNYTQTSVDIEGLYKQQTMLVDQIASVDSQIALLEALGDVPLKKFVPDGTGNYGSSSDYDSETKEVEEYIAVIDKYRKAIERLNRIQIRKADVDLELSNTEDLDKQVDLHSYLIEIYQEEQAALHNLNNLRDATIIESANTLRQIGFEVEYDPDKNRFFVENLEHLNELVASNQGDYETMQEATNAYRQETEALINTLVDLNNANQEGSDTWWELEYAIQEAKISIVNNLKAIVEQASEAVDEIQNVYDTLHEAADEYAANGGFISVDAFQKIVELGPEYMQYLRDENGLLVINEENINKVIAAKTQQLALENAMAYVERLRQAMLPGAIENLNTLLYATTESTNATWGLVYANLALLDLNGDQYQAALHNINAIRSLADNAIAGIGQTAGTVENELNDMKSGLDDILKYVMDMLRHRIEQQIDALEEMKEAYAEIIGLKKESLETAKEETEYQDEVADKVKEIAKLQERINALSLDDSRDAQAQKVQLQEEMAELQEELADTQADYALEAQKESLDQMQEAYEEEKDKEIAILENSISSEQKLYEMAIAYIKSNWDTLYQELIAWNTEYGSVLNSEITTAWENCLAAAQRYGSYVNALNNIDADISAAGSGNSSGSNYTVGATGNYNGPSNEDMVRAIVSKMKDLGAQWNTSNPTELNDRLHEQAAGWAARLDQYGVHADFEPNAGVWWITEDELNPSNIGKRLHSCYHTGGIAGDVGTLKENELLAKLEYGEPIISNKNKDALFSLIDFVDLLSKEMDTTGFGSFVSPGGGDVTPSDLSKITRNESIRFGDVYIYGTNEKTVEQHREVNRQFVNEMLGYLSIKR